MSARGCPHGLAQHRPGRAKPISRRSIAVALDRRVKQPSHIRAAPREPEATRFVDLHLVEADMQTKWMTLPELAADRHLTLAEAQRLVDESNCPKAFKAHGTVYLI